jgi:hypothetical protein
MGRIRGGKVENCGRWLWHRMRWEGRDSVERAGIYAHGAPCTSNSDIVYSFYKILKAYVIVTFSKFKKVTSSFPPIVAAAIFTIFLAAALVMGEYSSQHINVKCVRHHLIYKF